MGIFRKRAPWVDPFPDMWATVFKHAGQAIGMALDVLMLDTAYALSDNQKLDLAAGDPLMWRGLLGRWGRQGSQPAPPYYNPRHAKKGRR